jgi:hypothetical protein
MKPTIYELLDSIEPPPPEGPPAETPLDLFNAVLQDRSQPLPVRMRAARDAAPYIHAKLSTSVNINVGMGTRLEEAHRERFAPQSTAVAIAKRDADRG